MGNRGYVPQPAHNQILLMQVGEGKVSVLKRYPFNVFKLKCVQCVHFDPNSKHSQLTLFLSHVPLPGAPFFILVAELQLVQGTLRGGANCE